MFVLASGYLRDCFRDEDLAVRAQKPQLQGSTASALPLELRRTQRDRIELAAVHPARQSVPVDVLGEWRGALEPPRDLRRDLLQYRRIELRRASFREVSGGFRVHNRHALDRLAGNETNLPARRATV